MNDGGPAFPQQGASLQVKDSVYFLDKGGMSLRDYFAAAALAGISGDGIPGSHHRPEATARMAYDYADAMLGAREANIEATATKE